MSKSRSRAEQKESTRRAILDQTLALSGKTPLAAISVRHVAKVVGIAPASFYRHFDSIDELGLALVDESFASLRAVLREVRRGKPTPREIVSTSVEALVAHAGQRRDHFAFIARERFAGPPVVREAVRLQLALFESELAIDLARLAPAWSSDDVRAVAKLIVATMVETIADVIVGDLPADTEVRAQAETLIKMVLVGAIHWRSDHEAG
ncbi:TetR family transcriptional regulator [Nocardia sp. NPDC005825]|uniref:TetR family transcriptional regulator n=1 Tax=unclassified Nocardia TaxID=2637762 RepID=UPI00340E8151